MRPSPCHSLVKIVVSAEAATQKRIWLAAATLAGVVLFRANSGKAWLGHGPARRLMDGSVVLSSARPIALGLALANGDPVVGQGDLLGWHSMTITPEMVGCRIAVFLSIECKRTEGGRTSADQKHWRDMVLLAGGIAGVANSPEAAKKIIEDWAPVRRASSK